jgi:uncharacterized membrane protein YraQ (UPF0718 family)
MTEWKKFFALAAVFLVLALAPVDAPEVLAAFGSGLALLQEYVRLHVLTCLVPAFFIAGTIAVYVKKDALLRLLGPATRKLVAYPVASVSGGILAVCSCTILPLFTGIYKRGAGIGPATAFLFAGPAVNITAILLTAGVFGWEFAASRLIAALVISVVAGLVMAAVFRNYDRKNVNGEFAAGVQTDLPYSTGVVLSFLAVQLGVLVVFGLPVTMEVKAIVAAMLLAVMLFIVFFKFERDHNVQWVEETWTLTKQILPYLFVGVFLAGIVEVVVPRRVVMSLVGENTLGANAMASTFGALMYFATLTEVPIIQKLMALGMDRGPAMTLFLTGNSLSIPSMIVLFGVMGRNQAAVYIVTIIVLSVFVGFLYGTIA